MANVKCPKCSNLISGVSAGQTVKCPKCGNTMKLAAPASSSSSSQANKNEKEEINYYPLKRKKKKSGIIKWVIISVVVLAIIGAASGGEEDSEPRKVSNESQQSQTVSNKDNIVDTKKSKQKTEKDAFSVGETAEMNDVQVTMTNYEESAGSEYNKPSDGNVFVLVEFEIANNSDKELAVSSMMSFEAYADDYALNYSLGALMEKSGENQLDGTIAAGKKMKGIIGYEVPTDWREIEIHFTEDFWDNNKFIFSISK